MSLRSRPEEYSYSFSSLKSLPRRILSPPPAEVPTRSRATPFHIRPAYDVRLEDLFGEARHPLYKTQADIYGGPIAGRYRCPLALADFEEWLLYTEHSVENLFVFFLMTPCMALTLSFFRYFIQWLKDYTARHAASSGQPAFSLDVSALRAKNTFFVAGGSMELNLSASVVEEIQQSCTRPPDPSIFSTAKSLVTEMLESSLTKFVNQSSANSDANRRLCAILAGVAWILAGFAPGLVSVLGGYNRWIRLCAFPLFWIGGLMAFAGYGGELDMLVW